MTHIFRCAATNIHGARNISDHDTEADAEARAAGLRLEGFPTSAVYRVELEES